MEKLLLVINARKPDTKSIDFACRLASLTGTKLTGLFIENIYFGHVPVDINGPSYFERIVSSTAETAVETETQHAIRIFVDECAKNKVPQEVYLDKGEPIQEILFESRFADLVILDPKFDFYNTEGQMPSHLVKEILSRAECPVILTPEKWEETKEIVFCYDGTASSVYAMKQFTYLLPQFSGQKALLLEVSESEKDEFDDGHQRSLNWLKAHYAHPEYKSLKGASKDELFTYLWEKQGRWVVMGAYGRTVLSRFFKRSEADIVIRTADLPLFITHY